MDPEKIGSFLPPMPPGLKWKVTTGVLVMALMAHAAWSLGMFSIIGFNGPANADDVQKQIDTGVAQVQKEVAAVKQQTQSTEQKVDAVADSLNAVLADLYAKKIRESVRRRCKTSPDDTAERDRIQDQIDLDQREYRKYSESHVNYPLPSCSEV